MGGLFSCSQLFCVFCVRYHVCGCSENKNDKNKQGGVSVSSGHRESSEEMLCIFLMFTPYVAWRNYYGVLAGVWYGCGDQGMTEVYI